MPEIQNHTCFQDATMIDSSATVYDTPPMSSCTKESHSTDSTKRKSDNVSIHIK